MPCTLYMLKVLTGWDQTNTQLCICIFKGLILHTEFNKGKLVGKLKIFPLTVFAWVCVSIRLIVGSCVTVLGEVCRADFSSWHPIAFSSRRSGFCKTQCSRGWEASGFLLLLWLKMEEGPIFTSSMFISCSSLHLYLSQPCYKPTSHFFCWNCCRPRSCLSHPHCTAQPPPHRATWKSANICNSEVQQIIRRSCWNGLKMLCSWQTPKLGGTSWHGCASMRESANTWAYGSMI